ncbi:MAG: efflux RND transporter periplasmic adaptor subunit [Terriglobales bacterium]
MRTRNRRWSGAGLAAGLMLALAALAGGLGGCSAHGGHTVRAAEASLPPLVATAPVRRERPRLSTDLPAELDPYQDVVLRARVPGFVARLYADRGTRVRAGQLLATIEAPDLVAKVGQAEQQLSAARAQRAEAQAALARDQATLQRLSGAAQAMPGAVAGNDITVAQQTVKMDAAQSQSRAAAEAAAQKALQSVTALEQYLQVRAPFSGMVVTRMISAGALVGPGGVPMFEVQQLDPLRLTVDVPEAEVGGAAIGDRVAFTVTSAPGRTFTAVVARIAHSLLPQTRTMPVEADAANPQLVLAPGMFARVLWPVQRRQPTLYVPTTAVLDTTLGQSVEVVRNGKIAMVPVTTGFTDGAQMEVFGPLQPGDPVVTPGDKTLAAGSAVRVAASGAGTGS